MPDELKIKERLEEVLHGIFCPIGGCWPLHGYECEYFYDPNDVSYVLEVWPIGVQESTEHQGNGHHSKDGLLYELAEFDFSHLADKISLEHFHFSQRRSMFDFGWKEGEKHLELRVHVLPRGVGEGH